MGAWLDPSLCPELSEEPRRKFWKATDLSLVFRGLQEQCVNQSDGVGLDLLVRTVSTETGKGVRGLQSKRMMLTDSLKRLQIVIKQ